jgi:hypothetical protein
MTLYEMKQKVFAMIEEINPNSAYLTDDPDLKAKVNEVINQVQFEMSRMKKISKYVETEVSDGDVVTFADIEKKCGSEVYQISLVAGVKHTSKANGTVLKFLENGTAEIDVFVYPERITEKTKDKAYEFELSPDCLEILPYGIAADLLKSDVSAEYGSVYASRYESMLQRLDPRYQTNMISVEGGFYV